MIETTTTSQESPISRRTALKAALGALVNERAIVNAKAPIPTDTTPLEKEGVELVDKNLGGLVFRAHHNPLIDEGTLRLHICLEDQGTADITTRQVNEAGGLQPGYLVINHQEAYSNSCFDVNAVTGQAQGEIDDVLLGINGNQEKHVWRFERTHNGELQGSYTGKEVVDFSTIKPRDPL